MGHFIAIDVETANQDRSSICQIGLACFDGGVLAWEWSTLVDPEDEFDPFNIKIHGITAERIVGAAKWPAVVENIAAVLHGQIIVSHTSFDQIALTSASDRYGVDMPECNWIDSYAIARQVWPEMGRHRLRDLCTALDIELNHHDALSDAIACGRIVLAGLQRSGLTFEQLIAQQAAARPRSHISPPHRRLGAKHQKDYVLQGFPTGPLHGQIVVFTGEFEGGKRSISELAAAAGCEVDDNFTKSRTTILVAGRRDPATWGGAEKSSKHRHAEEAIAEGRKIEIMSEEQFRDLLQRSASNVPLAAAS